MNEDQVKAFRERLNDKIEAQYQGYLKDKLDLIFCGPDGIPRPNNMARKMQQVLTKKWKVEPLSTVDKYKLKEKVQKKIGRSIKFVSDFHGGYAIIAILNSFSGPSYNIINKDGELQLRNNFYGEIVMLMGHILLKNRYDVFIFDETHDGEKRYHTTIDGDFHEGLARVHKSTNFMTDDGELFFSRDLHYGEFSDFHEGYARYKCGNTVDYVDHNGKCLFGTLSVKEIQIGWHDYIDALDWSGTSPYEDGEDFHNGYAKVKKDGKWNLIDYSGKEVFKEFYDEISNVEAGKVKIKKDGKTQTAYLDMRDYQIKRVLGGYLCTNSYEKIRIKYQPVKSYGLRYLLCNDDKNYYLYDKFLKKYILLGPIDSYIYDDNFLYDMEDETMYLIYNEQIIDITEYYINNLKDKETISISPRVTGILSRDIFRIKNNDEIEAIIREAKDENLGIIDKQKKEKEKQDIEKLKVETEQAEKERLENLRQALADLKDVIERVKKYSRPGDAPRRIPISIPFVPTGDHLELPVEIKGILKYIDISGETFANVNVEGVDFTGCNPHLLDPQLVYKKSLRNCKFEKIYINPFTDFTGVDIRGCSFSEDGNPLTVDVFNESFARAIYDETTKYNGVAMTELLSKDKPDKMGV